ncbi:MAG TPA: hypothetical protein VK181_06395 [Rhizobium sp.]|nr:hypothetical protein [Rhizobium sp.]
MQPALRDIAFPAFTWRFRADGDLGEIEGLASIRDLIVRWLLTEPAPDVSGLDDEEVEKRRAHQSADARRSSYAEPEGEGLTACIPWDPTFGAGIKSFASAPVTAAFLAELETRVRAGLSRLQGVRRVLDVRVSSIGGEVTVYWQVETDFGTAEETTPIRR